MFIAIILFLHYLIECYHWANDNIHLLFNKKTLNFLRKEKEEKEREQDYLFWKIKKQWVKSIKDSEYMSYAVEFDLLNQKPCVLWKFEELGNARKKTLIISHSCEICGDYDYTYPYCNCIKCKDITYQKMEKINPIQLPYHILCKCEKYDHNSNEQ